MAKAKKSGIPYRNKSPHGWWITQEVECFEPADADRRNAKRRCKVWLNTIIFQASDREAAYRKAMAMGKIGNGIDGFGKDKYRRTFLGLRYLLPVYDKIGTDWAEVLWQQRRGMPMERAKSLVKAKRELEAFDDTGGADG